MNRKMNNVEEKFELLNKQLWSFDQINDKYGLSIGDGKDRILAQYRTWVEAYRTDYETVLNRKPDLINRCYLELFFQARELVPIRYAAISFAMDIPTFKDVLVSAYEKCYISENDKNGEFENVYRISTLNFYKNLKSLQHRMFANYNDFIDSLYDAIKVDLGMEMPPPIICTAARSIKQNDYATTFDSLTEEPLGLRFKEFLHTNKPIQLSPDVCSTKTYLDNKKLLFDKILGKINEEFESSYKND